MNLLIKIFSLFLVNFIKIINFFIKKDDNLFCNKIIEKLEDQLYVKKNIFNTQINFYCPNKIIEWRVNNLLEKEPKTIEWINNFNGDKIIFWDVGANIGTYSIYAALKHFGKIKINSFEPSTSNLRVLSRNISINNYQNEIDIVQLPLFNKNLAFSSMNESRFLEGAALHSFSVDYNYKGEKFNINNKYNLIGTSIDFLLENKVLSSPPNYIKIDVDGAEHLILDGAKKLLSSENKPLEILIELHKEFEDQYNKIFDIMKKYDYELINFYPGQIEYIFRSK